MKFEERVLQQEFTLNDTDDLIVDYIRKNKQIWNIYQFKR